METKDIFCISLCLRDRLYIAKASWCHRKCWHHLPSLFWSTLCIYIGTAAAISEENLNWFVAIKPQIVFLGPHFDVIQLSGTRLYAAGWYYQVRIISVAYLTIRLARLTVWRAAAVTTCDAGPIPEPDQRTMLAVMARIAGVTPPYLMQCICPLK